MNIRTQDWLMSAGLLVATCGSSAAQPLFDEVVGDALTVQAAAAGRSGTAVIPRAMLSASAGLGVFEWSSGPVGVEVVAGDGTVLGSFSGSVEYDAVFDNIRFVLNFFAGGADTRFTVRSADLAESFTSGGDQLMTSATLLDRNGDGAQVTGLIDGFLARAEWNGVPQVSALPGFAAMPGGSVFIADTRTAAFTPFVGTKVLREDFQVSAGDELRSFVDSVTSIPAPGAVGLLGLGVLVSLRRR